MLKNLFLLISFFLFNCTELTAGNRYAPPLNNRYTPSTTYRYELALCAVFQNEAPFLREWIEFHLENGVEHFVLCSHNSTDNFIEVLQPYIDTGIVELKVLSNDPNVSVQDFNAKIQCAFYTDTLVKLRGVAKWAVFIDSDEFLFSPGGISLVEVLREYESYGGVCANWQMFGTSFIEKLSPEELQIERLTMCIDPKNPVNRHVKSIVRPERASAFLNPHFAIYLPEFFQVDTDCVPFTGPLSTDVKTDKLRINHYWTRTIEYYDHYKLPRQIGWWNHTLEQAYAIRDALNEKEAFDILIYAPALKRRMNL